MRIENLERETGFEPATSTLARSHSTAELLPLGVIDYKLCCSFPRRAIHDGSAATCEQRSAIAANYPFFSHV